MSLAVILDFNLAAWQSLSSPNNESDKVFEHCFQSLAFFLKAHLLMTDRQSVSTDLSSVPSAGNDDDEMHSDLIVLASGIRKTTLIYPSSPESKPSAEDLEQSVYGPVAMFDCCYKQSMSALLQEYDFDNGLLGNPSISQSISKALCYLNAIYRQKKLVSGQHGGGSKILIVSVSKDDPRTYVSLMNSIFSAQKLNIPINVCRLKSAIAVADGDAVFLKQAAYLTGGIYVELDDHEQLMQHLLNYFLVKEQLDSDMSLSSTPLNQQSHLPSIKAHKTQAQQLTQQFSHFKQLRSWLSSDMGRQVDFRAACFCHKRIVDLGFICSVCLAIYCEPFQQCSTCGIKMEKP